MHIPFYVKFCTLRTFAACGIPVSLRVHQAAAPDVDHRTHLFVVGHKEPIEADDPLIDMSRRSWTLIGTLDDIFASVKSDIGTRLFSAKVSIETIIQSPEKTHKRW